MNKEDHIKEYIAARDEEITSLLASNFAAKKENEELKAKIKKLESSAKVSNINIDSLVVEMGKMEDYRRVLDNSIIDRYRTIDQLLGFLKLLEQHPMFWGISYKKSIERFLSKNFPER